LKKFTIGGFFIWKLSFLITEDILRGGRQRNDRRY